jgi:uncharacterized membrane protein YqjE
MMELFNTERDKGQQHVDRLIKNLTGLLDTQLRLLRLEIKGELSNAIAVMAVVMFVSLLGAFVVVLLSIAFALALGNWIGSSIAGYLIVAALYAIVLFGAIRAIKPIQRRVSAIVDEQIKKLESKN